MVVFLDSLGDRLFRCRIWRKRCRELARAAGQRGTPRGSRRLPRATRVRELDWPALYAGRVDPQ